MPDYETYDLGDFGLQNGETLPGAFIGRWCQYTTKSDMTSLQDIWGALPACCSLSVMVFWLNR